MDAEQTTGESVLKPFVDTFVSRLEPGRTKELVESLVENPAVLGVLSAAESSGKAFLTNLPEDKRRLAMSVLSAAQQVQKATEGVRADVGAAAQEAAQRGGEQATLLGTAAKKQIEKTGEDIDVFTGVLKEAAHASFYKHTQLGRSIRRGFRFTKGFIIVLWILTLALVGLTVWRATRPAPDSTNGLSVGIYVATAYTFVLASIALLIYELAQLRVRQEVDRALDRLEGVLETFGAKAALKKVAQLRA